MASHVGAEADALSKAPASSGQLSKSLCAFCQFLRGSIAGTTAKTIVYPLDRLKMRLQVKSAATGASFSVRRLPHELSQLVRSEGLLSLWKGNSSALCRTFPHSGIVYFSFERYLGALERLNTGGSKTNRLLAGAAAGTTSTCITYPLDVLNTRMSVTKYRLSYRQVSMLRHEGMISVYRGFLPTLLGIMPYASISFFTFETLKQQYLDKNKEFTTVHAVACGGFAGALGQTVSYPLDTVRKLMQANNFLYKYREEGHLGSRHPTIIESIRHIYRYAGIKGLYNGASLCWIKGFSAASISFTLNESFRGVLHESLCPLQS